MRLQAFLSPLLSLFNSRERSLSEIIFVKYYTEELILFFTLLLIRQYRWETKKHIVLALQKHEH